MKKILIKKNYAYLLILLGLIGLIWAGFKVYQNNQIPSVPGDNLNFPSSKTISTQEIKDYNVLPTNPRYISISAIHLVNVPVLKLGLLSSGAIATPDNIYEAGWYANSSLPGQKGAMFIYGHVSSWTADGVFYNLKNLKIGDLIKITTGNNQAYNYVVIKKTIYAYNNVNMAQVLSPVNSQLPGLNLMTCTGQVIPHTSEFNQRLVVFTELIS